MGHVFGIFIAMLTPSTLRAPAAVNLGFANPFE
jgi:hypothetical protein